MQWLRELRLKLEKNVTMFKFPLFLVLFIAYAHEVQVNWKTKSLPGLQNLFSRQTIQNTTIFDPIDTIKSITVAFTFANSIR